MIRTRALAAVAALTVLLGAGGVRAEEPEVVEGVVLEVAAEPGAPAERLLQVDGELFPTDSTVASGTPVVAVESGSGYEVQGPAAPVAEAVAPGDVVHAVTVLMYAPSGRTPDKTLAEAVAATEQAAAYWRDQSRGQIDLQVVRQVDWRSGTSTCAATSAFFTETAQLAGFTPGRNQHLLVVVPRSLYEDRTCALGRATVGGSLTSGGYSHVVQAQWSDIAHELGHNFSLGHADALTCRSASGDTRFPSIAGCTHAEYGDWFSAMAASGTHIGRGSISAPHLHHLGLEDGAPVVTGTTTQTVTLAPLSVAAPSSPRYARVVDPGGDTYFLEYRTRSGRDAVLGSALPFDYGVRVLKALPGQERVSAVLDPTPSGARDRLESLGAGASWTGATGRVRISVTAATDTGATVQVQTGATPLPGTPGAGDATALTAAVSAPVTQAGRPFTVTGTLAQGGVAAKGVPVALQRRGDDGTWTTLRTARTSAAGVVSLPGGKAETTSTVRLAVVPGTHGVPALVSSDVVVRVTPGRAGPSAPAGPFLMSGHVSAGQVVPGKDYAVVARAVSTEGVTYEGLQLELSTRPAGSSGPFTSAGTRPTSAAGLATFLVRSSGTPLDLRVSAATGAEVMVTAPVLVAPVSVVKPPVLRAAATATVLLRTPAPEGARFRLEVRPLDSRRRPVGDWTVRGTVTGTVVDAGNGLAGVPLSLPAGRHELRVVRLDSATVRGGTSQVVRLSVTTA